MDASDSKNVMARVGQVIRRRRVAIQLGQEAFADLAGMHRTTCSLIERGRQSPTIVMLARMAAALGTSMADILAEVEAANATVAEPTALKPGRRSTKSSKTSNDRRKRGA